MPVIYIITEDGELLDTEDGIHLITEDSTFAGGAPEQMLLRIGYPFPDATTTIGVL